MNKLHKFLILIFVSAAALGAIFFYQDAKINDGNLRVVFCDVGQGDSIFIRTPKGQDILVDGGPSDSVLRCLSNNMPFYDRDLELVLLTHPHADHLAGLISVAENYTIKSFATQFSQGSGNLYNKLIKKLKEQNVSPELLSQNDKYTLDKSVTLKTEWPPKSLVISKEKSTADYFDQNESSLIELLEYGDFSVLLTGDAGLNAEKSIAQNLGSIDILKVSHHGSKTGTDEEILQEFAPSVAVITVGKNNRYGLPYPKTIESLNNLKIKTLRTDQNGEIQIISDGQKWSIKLTTDSKYIRNGKQRYKNS
ncbi:MAG: MBL fold metallo-hydrolase, partial [Patescibacteria group bacterium]|nr:MBL fold metallo-hydrolase [Patescibacteria group bacterium]